MTVERKGKKIRRETDMAEVEMDEAKDTDTEKYYTDEA